MELDHYLKYNEISDTRFAELSGVDPTILRRYRKGKAKHLSMLTIVRIMIATDNKVTIKDLFGDDEFRRMKREFKRISR